MLLHPRRALWRSLPWWAGARRCRSSAAQVTSIDSENFPFVKHEVERALHDASFVSFDCEFTGLHREKQQGLTALQSCQSRYSSLRRSLTATAMIQERCSSCGSEVLEDSKFCSSCGVSLPASGWTAKRRDETTRQQGFLIVQVGLSCFKWLPEEGRYDIKVYSFYLSPKPWTPGSFGSVKVEHDLYFGCLSSALSFLSSYGFDFNRWIQRGVPFLSRASYHSERERLEYRGQHLMATELEEAKGFLEVWDAMLAAGKPLVGHQCLLDLLYLWNQLEGPLPKDLSLFLRAVASRIRIAVDTKHVLNAYPHDLHSILTKRLQESRASRDPASTPTRSEVACTELLTVIEGERQGGSPNLQLTDLYQKLLPLAEDRVLPLDKGLSAHDAGVDAYMTGVVFIALHSLLHGDTPPSSDLLMKFHTASPSSFPLPLGSLRSFQYVNNLHVFASPFAFNLSSPTVPTLEETHSGTLVIVPALGGMIDAAKLHSVLRGVVRYSEVYWVEFQHTAVVTLHARKGVEGLPELTEKVTNAVQPFGWSVHRSVDWVNDQQRPVDKPARRFSQRAAKTKRKHGLNTRRLIKRRTAKKRSVVKELTKARDRAMHESLTGQEKLASLQRQFDEAQKELVELRERELAWSGDRKLLMSLRAAEAEWKMRERELVSDREVLERRSEDLGRGVDDFRQQAEQLRLQLNEAQRQLENTTIERNEAEAVIETLKEAEKEWKRTAAALSRPSEKEEAAPDPSPGDGTLEKLRKKRALRDEAGTAPSSPGTQTATQDKPTPRTRPWHREQKATRPSPSPRNDVSDRRRKARVEEVRSGQWILERKGDHRVLKEGEIQQTHDIILRPWEAGPKRPQVLNVRECRHLRIFLCGSLGSLTLTDCEHITIYCEGVMCDPAKASWADTSKPSTPKILYYNTDKATTALHACSRNLWPEIQQGAEEYGVSMAKQRRQAPREVEWIRTLLVLVVLLLVVQLSVPIITRRPRLEKSGTAVEGDGH
eukprot:Sspe_Gene.85059::Locus_55882_Transcript_1_1_Confidence_1.000_Length_3039::g.85059::m.85059